MLNLPQNIFDTLPDKNIFVWQNDSLANLKSMQFHNGIVGSLNIAAVRNGNVKWGNGEQLRCGITVA